MEGLSGDYVERYAENESKFDDCLSRIPSFRDLRVFGFSVAGQVEAALSSLHDTLWHSDHVPVWPPQSAAPAGGESL